MASKLLEQLSLKTIPRTFKGTLLCLLVTVLVVTLYLQHFPALERLDLTYEDRLRAGADLAPDTENIAVVGIDSRSIAIVGDWPWNHGQISDLLITICDCKPKAVMLDFPLAERMEEFLAGKSGELATSIRECGNVVVPFDVVVSDQGKLSRSAPPHFRDFALDRPQSFDIDELPVAAAAFAPPEIFATRAEGIGFYYYASDIDDRVRSASLLLNYEGHIYPAAPLVLAAIYRDEDPAAIKIGNGGDLEIGTREVPIDNSGRMLLRFPPEGHRYRTYSAIDILTGEVDRNSLSGKAVIISSTSPDLCVYMQTATAGVIPAHTYTAAIVQQILTGSYPARLKLSLPLDLILVLLLGVGAGLALPRIALRLRLIALLVSGGLLLASSLLLFESFGLVLPLVYPSLALGLLFLGSLLIEQQNDEEKWVHLSEKKSRGLSDTGPIAIDRDANRAVKLADIPRLLLLGEKPSQEALQETIRLDFEALTNARPILGTPEARQPEPEEINIDLSEESESEPADAGSDLNSTRIITAEMLGVEQLAGPGAATEGEPEPVVRPEPEIISAGDELPPVATETPDRPEVQHEVRFSPDGQPLSFGRYQVIEPVGSGAMGTVYKGNDPAIDRLVALKTIRFDAIADSSEVDELMERLTREAIAAGNLSHPNIVTIYDVGVQANLQYIAMEFLEGYTLEALLKRNLQLNFRIVASIIMQVSAALQYAHDAGIIHRDVKPANIMLLSDFKVKVMDFGIAHTQSSSMTQTGIAMGTPSYISPELLQGQEVTPATDIYSLGVVLYELLTHRKPFIAENISSLAYKIVNDDPPSPSSLDDKTPTLFDHIIRKALAKNPQERYRTAKELSASLEDFTVSVRSKAGVV